MAPFFTGITRAIGGAGFGKRAGGVAERGFGVFSVSPGASPIGSTWNASTSPEISITTGDYTLTASSPYSIYAYIWGAGGANAPANTPGIGGSGGFSYGIINGNTNDILVLKSRFGSGSPGGGGAYGIFVSSFAQGNSRLIAGGGGGSGLGDNSERSQFGGSGGGTSGSPGEVLGGGGGGTPSAGGAGGIDWDIAGSAGSALQGGNGAYNSGYFGGGGGGGYFGGGGGSLEISWVGGGGGGGSGYIHPTIISGITTTGYINAPAGSEPYRNGASQPAAPGKIYLK